MLAFGFLSKETGCDISLTWYVEGKSPPQEEILKLIVRANTQGYDVCYCSASFQELAYLKEHFPNLCIPTHKTEVTWFGDTALFVVSNL